jgi:hypothetical protein
MTGRRSRILGFCIAGVLAGVVTASAQVRPRAPLRRAPGEPRVTLALSGGIQSAAARVSDRITFDRNVEAETIDVKYPKRPGALLDIGGRVRVWKRLGAGIAVDHVVGEGTADVSASVPHPFFFNQPRTVTGKQSAMSHEETALHLQVQYTIPASKHVRLVLGAGPSRIKLTKDVVTDVAIEESYPYDTATFTRAITRGATASVNGFNVGLDVTWHMTRSFGFGGLVRYTRADADLEVRSGHRLAARAGGAQAAAGVRVAF